MSSELREAMADYARGCYGAQDWGDAPWLVDGALAVTTNGHGMLAVPSARISGDVSAAPARLTKPLSGWRGAAAIASRTVPAEALVEFAGVGLEPPPVCKTCKGEREIECAKCDGEGSSECECMSCGDLHTGECGDCHGAGIKKCRDCHRDDSKLPALLLGVCVDRLELRPVLAMAGPSGDVTVETFNTGGYPKMAAPDCLRFIGDGWWAVVMALRDIEPRADFDNRETWPVSDVQSAERVS